MRKTDIARLVAIQAFSVQRIEFGKEAILVETRGCSNQNRLPPKGEGREVLPQEKAPG